ncbi:MAG: YihY/virulence factor BrkB family protein [Candidatus Spyradenecus sp.]
MFAKVKAFLVEHLWRLDLAEYPRGLRLLIRLLRFAMLTVRCYLRDGSILHASALTYITMMAVIPVLTLGLTSLKAFGAGELAEQKLMENIDSFVGQMNAREQTATPIYSPDSPPPSAAEEPPAAPTDAAAAAGALRDLCRTVFEQIDSINFAKIGTVGAVALIFMVISVLGKVENSFNAIWGIRKARPIWRKFTDYLSVIIVVPLLVLAATSLPVLDSITQMMPNLWGIHAFIERFGIASSLLSLSLGTLLFAFLFGFLPNTHVRVPSAFLGAAVTTVVLSLFFKLCMVLQIGIANYSRLYGSLIALPILLFWIYSSWQIILLGAEICYVHQHRRELLRESAFTHPSERDTIVLALALTLATARTFEEVSQALTVSQFADAFALPEREVLRVAAILEHNRILLPVIDSGSTVPSGYVLSRSLNRLTVADIINACLDDTPGENLLLRAEAIGQHTPLSDIERRFSDTLSAQFKQTLAEALTAARAAAPEPLCRA